MDTIIDLGSEVVIDRTRIRDPYVRLMVAALGQRLAAGSPWVALDKALASRSSLSFPGRDRRRPRPRPA